MKTHNPLGVLGVTLAVTLIMSGVPAQAQQFDSDPHPLDVRESGPTLTHEDAAHLARQLDPVRLRVHEKDTPSSPLIHTSLPTAVTMNGAVPTTLEQRTTAPGRSSAHVALLWPTSYFALAMPHSSW